MMVYFPIFEWVENAIAKWFYRPNDYLVERWKFLKISLCGASLVGMGLSFIIIICQVDVAKALVVIVLVTAMLFAFDQTRIKQKKEWYEKWWRGEIPKWKIFV
jgi:hypothetical protein